MQLRAKKSFCQIEQLQKAVQTITILSRWLWCWCDHAYVDIATAAAADGNNADAIAIAFDADVADVDLATDDGDVGDGGDDVHEDTYRPSGQVDNPFLNNKTLLTRPPRSLDSLFQAFHGSLHIKLLCLPFWPSNHLIRQSQKHVS